MYSTEMREVHRGVNISMLLNLLVAGCKIKVATRIRWPKVTHSRCTRCGVWFAKVCRAWKRKCPSRLKGKASSGACGVQDTERTTFTLHRVTLRDDQERKPYFEYLCTRLVILQSERPACPVPCALRVNRPWTEARALAKHSVCEFFSRQCI